MPLYIHRTTKTDCREYEYCQSQRMWNRCFQAIIEVECTKVEINDMDGYRVSSFTMIMECHLLQCIGNTPLLYGRQDIMHLEY